VDSGDCHLGDSMEGYCAVESGTQKSAQLVYHAYRYKQRRVVTDYISIILFQKTFAQGY